MASGDGSFTLFHSATSFRVMSTFCCVHYLYPKAVYFHHLRNENTVTMEYLDFLSLSHTHTCAPIHICMDNTCSFAVGELPKSS